MMRCCTTTVTTLLMLMRAVAGHAVRVCGVVVRVRRRIRVRSYGRVALEVPPRTVGITSPGAP
jgi:hypothetical protein